MRLYLGTAALQVGVGFILGALLGYLVGVAVQRWRNVRELRRIQQRVMEVTGLCYRCGSPDVSTVATAEGKPICNRCIDRAQVLLETELRRRNL